MNSFEGWKENIVDMLAEQTHFLVFEAKKIGNLKLFQTPCIYLRIVLPFIDGSTGFV